MRRFTIQGTNQGFTCQQCGAVVLPLENGSVRNHCPQCLFSLHVDIFPGDRASKCGGLLEPVAVEYSGKKGWIIVHRCQKCGFVGKNKAALDDPNASDNYNKLVELSQNKIEPVPPSKE